MKRFSGVLLLCCVYSLQAQLPETDIWLVDMKNISTQTTPPAYKNITSRKGYDNQPSFSVDGRYIYYSSVREDKKSHIYRYDLNTDSILQITRTETSEYSPMLMPDGKSLSVVRVEADSTQRLWKFPLNGRVPSLLLDKIDSVGYYCWIDKKTIALNIISKPPALNKVKTDGKKVVFSYRNKIGRCFQKYLKGILLTVKKDSIRQFFYLDESNKLNLITNALDDNEDFCVWNGNVILMSKGHTLYKFEIGKSKDWELFAILTRNITRLAVSPNGEKLAVVVSE